MKLESFFWYEIMQIAAVLFVFVAIIDFISYKLKLASISKPKEKYDYISLHAIPRLKRVFLWFSITALFIVNTYAKDEVNNLSIAFFVRLFFSVAGATLVYYISSLILEYYYPTRLNRKLNRLRNQPRVNAKSGNVMRLLREDEEDVHLDDGMRAEEDIFSVDYDVWIDDKTGDIEIEKYQGHQVAVKCNNCGFYTMRVFKEELVEKNEQGEPQELLKHYRCTYCKNLRATQFKISKREKDDFKNFNAKDIQGASLIEMVDLTLTTKTGKTRSFDFKSIDQLKKFIDSYDYKQIE